MQLNPGEKFTISRQLFDPADADTNYVRAVVRNALTDTLLKTIDLVDRGSRRFTQVYEVPADVSGQGFYITVTTQVFSDSGYTTYNMNYGEEQNTYLVQARKSGLEGGGGWGADVDYDKIKKIYKTIGDTWMKELKDFIKNNQPEPINLGPIIMANSVLLNKLEEMDKKEYPKTNLGPLIKATEAIVKTLDLLPKEIPTVDLNSLHEAIEAFQESCKTAFNTIVQSIDGLPEKSKMMLTQSFDDLKESVESTKSNGFVLKLDKPEKNKKTEPENDIDPRVKKLIQPHA